jgi:hypothetical protein
MASTNPFFSLKNGGCFLSICKACKRPYNSKKEWVLMADRVTNNFNLPGKCACYSKFNIKANMNFLMNGNILVAGILFLTGAICPYCNNKKSNFTLSFKDNDLSDDNYSFNFKSLAICPPICEEITDPAGTFLIQRFTATGIYKPTVGKEQLERIQLSFSEPLTPEQNGSVRLFIGFNPVLARGTALMQDGELKIKECDDCEDEH